MKMSYVSGLHFDACFPWAEQKKHVYPLPIFLGAAIAVIFFGLGSPVIISCSELCRLLVRSKDSNFAFFPPMRKYMKWPEKCQDFSSSALGWCRRSFLLCGALSSFFSLLLLLLFFTLLCTSLSISAVLEDKGNTCHRKREEVKPQTVDFHSELTRSTNCECACATRNKTCRDLTLPKASDVC